MQRYTFRSRALSQTSVTSDLRARLTMYMHIICSQQKKCTPVVTGLFSVCLVAEMYLMGSDLTKDCMLVEK